MSHRTQINFLFLLHLIGKKIRDEEILFYAVIIDQVWHRLSNFQHMFFLDIDIYSRGGMIFFFLMGQDWLCYILIHSIVHCLGLSHSISSGIQEVLETYSIAGLWLSSNNFTTRKATWQVREYLAISATGF